MMFLVYQKKLLLILLSIVLLAAGCNLPGNATPVSQDAIYTIAAQTVVAQFTLTALVMPGETLPTEEPPPQVQDTPTETIPPLPSDTPTLEFTPTESFTPTPDVPIISASTNTNCRRGPSIVYQPPVGVLAVGQEARVYGRNSAGTWWYIENLTRKGEYCWVWGETTKVQGNTTNLPVITPPPPPPTATFTPTPGAKFSAAYDNVHACSGTPTAIFKINNSGGPLDSLSLKIEDITDADTLFGPDTSNAPFMGTSGECPPGGDVLPAGKTMYVGGAIGSGNSGHSARATIKLCTAKDLGGICETRTVEFTIP